MFERNTVLDTGNCGFHYDERNFASSHLFWGSTIAMPDESISSNTFVKGIYCKYPVAASGSLSSVMHDNECYIQEEGKLLSSIYDDSRNEISVKRHGKTMEAIKIYR